MAARFAEVSQEEIDKIKQENIPKKTKQATKYGFKIFQSEMFLLVLFLCNKTGFFTSKVVIWAWIILCKQTISKVNKTWIST